MHSKVLNFSTGPVQISKEVRSALACAPLSHRSAAFQNLLCNTTAFLCATFNTKQTFLLTGSGTAANEAMIWQIKQRNEKGLVFSNGEFGNRLMVQASRAGLNFGQYIQPWGETFDLTIIENIIVAEGAKWLLFCHCETSAGMLNDLAGIVRVAAKNHCLCFVDCISSVGNSPLDLSRVAMATASSGKGLASVAGLGIVFSNIEVCQSTQIPLYFDLGWYAEKKGIPFTISSQLVQALKVAIGQKLHTEQFALTNHYAQASAEVLQHKNLLFHFQPDAKVFTVAANSYANVFVRHLHRHKIVISSESEYLQKKEWCQVAFFGYYCPAELKHFLKALKETVAAIN